MISFADQTRSLRRAARGAGRYASMVKRLRRCPLKAKSGVRFPLEVPQGDSDVDTISGSFLLHFFGSAMQNLRDFELKLAFGGEELQDYVSLNQMLNLLPNG